MNKDFEKRMLIVFVVLFGLTAGMMFLMPKPQPSTLPEATNVNNTVAAAATNQAPAAAAAIFSNVVLTAEKTAPTNVSIAWSNETAAEIDTYGGAVKAYTINGKWNRSKTPVSLVSSNTSYRPGDLTLGSTINLSRTTERPVYSVLESTPSSVLLSARMIVQGSPVVVTKRYTMGSNYMFNLAVSVSNAGAEAVKLDSGGVSLSVGASFSFFTKETMAQGNMLFVHYYNGKDYKKALEGALFQARPSETTVALPQWMAFEDYYFLAVMKPKAEGASGKALLVAQDKTFTEAAVGTELPAFALAKGEAKNFAVDFYAGPKKESLATKAIPSLSKIFDWPVVFNWFMKPIEWLLHWGMSALSFIPNYGIIIILMALVIKLLLSPLSIKAAVSVKRMNLLQPKLKNLQEKYKDNQQELNQKMAELYKKEGVNPLGGCLPMLAQIPVFFALFRVLSTSVELRGANFLWIKDLTQPDTLFRLANLPMLGNFAFNLLPIVMTAMQMIQSLLQMQKNPAQGNQAMVNAIVMPVVFLFLFYGMPSGLVLYWTIQTVYTIFEQEFINLDRDIALNKDPNGLNKPVKRAKLVR